MKKINKNSSSEVKMLQKRIVVLEKLNAKYKELDAKINEARAYAQNIVETVREPLLIMDGSLKVVSANKAFYATFKVKPKETQGRFIYNLGNGQWDIPELRKLLKEIITKRDTLDDYEMNHKFETIGQKTMLLNARRIPPTPAKPRIILLAIEDISEKRELQQEITVGLEKKVRERTKQLDVVNEKLKEKISELEIFNKAAVGRELTMIELKKEIKELRKKVPQSKK
jgi:PAS domain S-box-containing protein